MASSRRLTSAQKASLKYHSIFDYPLTESELHKWESSKSITSRGVKIIKFENYFTLNKKNIEIRKKRKSISHEKFKIASRAGEWLKLIPTVRLVGVTGSLAMKNAEKGSDIDLMIITSRGALWTTRLLTYALLKFSNFKIRKPNQKEIPDALCLNIWLDESDLKTPKRNQNIYTAHELAQIKPVIDKTNTHKALIVDNMWISDYWPNAVEAKHKGKPANRVTYPHLWALFNKPFEYLAYKLQTAYMSSKVTRETVTPTKAFFHPIDWPKKVKTKLLTK